MRTLLPIGASVLALLFGPPRPLAPEGTAAAQSVPRLPQPVVTATQGASGAQADLEAALVAAVADEDPHATRAWLNAAVAVDPGDALAWADLALHADDPAARRRALGRLAATRANAGATERAEIEADARLMAGDLAGAAKVLQTAAEAAPADDDLARRVATVTASESTTAGDSVALAATSAILARSPGDPVALAAEARAQADRGRLDAASSVLRSLAAARPTAAAPLVELGGVLLAAKNLAGAVDAYRQALTRAPDDVRAFEGLAGAQRADDDAAGLRETLDALEKTVRTPGATLEAEMGRAALDLAAGRTDDAERELVSGLGWALDWRDYPYAPRLYEALAVLDLAAGDASRALDDLAAGSAFVDRSFLAATTRSRLRGETALLESVAAHAAGRADLAAAADAALAGPDGAALNAAPRASALKGRVTALAAALSTAASSQADMSPMTAAAAVLLALAPPASRPWIAW